MGVRMARFAWQCVTVGVAVISIVVVLGGCCDADADCESPISTERTDVSDAALPYAWTVPNATLVRVVAATGPYRISEFALEQLTNVMREQAGLEIQVVEGEDTGLAASGVLDDDDVSAAGWAQMPLLAAAAAVVVVVVEDTDRPDATFGFTDYRYRPHPRTVIVLHRGPIAATAIGPITVEALEATVVVHELGHSLGVPARDYHTSSVDGSHCTKARCVMSKGPRTLGPCTILANLCTGLPVRFCPECAEELAELRRFREVTPPPPETKRTQGARIGCGSGPSFGSRTGAVDRGMERQGPL